jgi:hypothetical protein
MTPLPIADWQAALAEMDSALDATLAALDRYQERWTEALAGRAAGRPEDTRLARLEERLHEWDARLTAAAELAASVERQLGEGEAAVGRWREWFTTWRDGIQRGVGEERQD